MWGKGDCKRNESSVAVIYSVAAAAGESARY
jgi:hypothetical protein